MPITVTMPRLSDTMEVGTVVQWHVKEGDTVSPGDVLADIETDKATMELEAFDEGTVAKLAASQGESVNVGDPIVIIAEEGEDVSEAARAGAEAAKSGGEAKAAAKSEGKTETKQAEGSSSSSASSGTATAPAPTSNGSTNGAASSERAGDGGRIFASPLAKKIAGEHNVDLAGIDGTGPSGRIVKKDVEHALESGGESAPASRGAPAQPELPPIGASLQDNTVTLSNMRGTIAKRLVQSKQSIPHYQVTVEVDMDALLDLREQLNEQLSAQGVKLTVNDFLVRACALAMHQHPFVNSSWDDSGKQPAIRQHGSVNIGVAVALPEERGGGLVVPVLQGTDRMGLRTISSETRRLAKKAREKGLSVEDMEGSTFTISNLGMFGVAHFTAIINPPNACILAVGAAREIPVVRDGQLMIGSVMSMTMSSDHRIVDGAMAAQYLNTVKGMLEAPATLLV
ncbi:MAG: pyruvate dehydrogenase complex dihydrolipoamide acetyltransferase [Phycisphaerales bacterium]|jgi:pyruvate dehydrogenase E2 component (dihydrolipoamide acetyltransferase)